MHNDPTCLRMYRDVMYLVLPTGRRVMRTWFTSGFETRGKRPQEVNDRPLADILQYCDVVVVIWGTAVVCKTCWQHNFC